VLKLRSFRLTVVVVVSHTANEAVARSCLMRLFLLYRRSVARLWFWGPKSTIERVFGAKEAVLSLNRACLTSAIILAGAGCTPDGSKPTEPTLTLIPRVYRSVVGGSTTLTLWDVPGQTCGASAELFWVEARFLNGAGSAVVIITGPEGAIGNAPAMPDLTGYSVTDSTNEALQIKIYYRSTFDFMVHKDADKVFHYIDNGGYVDGPYLHCRVKATWARKNPPSVASVSVQPRYDTLFKGSTGATYGARAYASDGYTEIFTTGSATWTNFYPSIISVTSTSPGSGPFGYPKAVVSANNLGTAILNISRQGATGGGQITVIPVNGGGCGLPHC
jgi:hypothetical protein